MGIYPARRELSQQARGTQDRVESSPVHCHRIPHPRGKGSSSDCLSGSRGKLRLGEEGGLPGSVSACPRHLPSAQRSASHLRPSRPVQPPGSQPPGDGGAACWGKRGEQRIPRIFASFPEPGGLCPALESLARGRGRTDLLWELWSPPGFGVGAGAAQDTGQGALWLRSSHGTRETSFWPL